MVTSGVNAGALVGQSFFSRPGRKKLAGETLCVVLMPLQPVMTSGHAASNDHRNTLWHNLTCRL